ncbi:MAG: dTMP kinase [bacterium]|nr:dTMP kinase [bacterium]
MTPSFITFEGLDGSGKSTHLITARDWFEDSGVRVLVTHEPGGTPLGDAIRSLFLDPRWGALDGTVETLMVFASRRQHLLEVIDPAIARGTVVLCDRFTDSTFAYQGFGRGVPLELLHRADALATGERVPDRTLLFDLPAEMARQRGQGQGRQAEPGGVDRLDAEDLEFYGRVRLGYLEAARREPDRFRVIDSAGSRQQTEEQVRAALADIVADRLGADG